MRRKQREAGVHGDAHRVRRRGGATAAYQSSLSVIDVSEIYQDASQLEGGFFHVKNLAYSGLDIAVGNARVFTLFVGCSTVPY